MKAPGSTPDDREQAATNERQQTTPSEGATQDGQATPSEGATQDEQATRSDGATGSFGVARVLTIAVLVTAAVTALSHLAPVDWSGSAVGIAFLYVSYVLTVRDSDVATIRHHGLSLGGLFEPTPLDARRALGDSARALLWAFGVALVVFPPFYFGFVGWWRPASGFHAASLRPVLDDALGQLLMVALPEEAFYRGYLQTRLDDHWKARLRLYGGHLSWGVVVSSAIFAVGHLLTEPHLTRLAVFFPSLLFGWLRTRTHGIGAGVVFHALCNLYSAYLGRSFGLFD